MTEKKVTLEKMLCCENMSLIDKGQQKKKIQEKELCVFWNPGGGWVTQYFQ